MSVYIQGVEQVIAHKARHQDTGADEISVAALSGELADRQPSKTGTSVLGWTDEKLLKGAGAGNAPDEIDVPDIAAHAALTETHGATGAVVGTTNTQTLTSKRVTQRVGTVADSATPTPDGDANDMFTVTALAQAATFAAPTGTPTNGQKLIIRILDNGTARALAWNAIYRAGTDVPLPTTTVLSKTLYCGFIYNSAATKWDLVAVTNNI